MIITREKIAEVALGLINVPYRHQGRNPKFGLDCGGLVIETMRQLDLDPIDVPNYSDSIRGNDLTNRLDVNLNIKDNLTPEIGDIILFWLKNPEVPRHLGIYVHDNKFIHVTTPVAKGDCNGKVFYSYLNDKWLQRIHTIYEIKEMVK